MLARFSVAYERFCRLLLTIFVVNIAMLVHTLLGAVVLGFFPSCAAAQTTFRTWLRAEDRSMRAKEVWGIFHGAWKNELKQANLFGWPLAVCWVVLAIDYYMMNWHARGTFDVAVSGILFAVIPFDKGLLLALMLQYTLPAPFIIPLFADLGDDAEYVSTTLSLGTVLAVVLFFFLAAFSLA